MLPKLNLSSEYSLSAWLSPIDTSHRAPEEDIEGRCWGSKIQSFQASPRVPLPGIGQKRLTLPMALVPPERSCALSSPSSCNPASNVSPFRFALFQPSASAKDPRTIDYHLLRGTNRLPRLSSPNPERVLRFGPLFHSLLTSLCFWISASPLRLAPHSTLLSPFCHGADDQKDARFSWADISILTFPQTHLSTPFYGNGHTTIRLSFQIYMYVTLGYDLKDLWSRNPSIQGWKRLFYRTFKPILFASSNTL